MCVRVHNVQACVRVCVFLLVHVGVYNGVNVCMYGCTFIYMYLDVCIEALVNARTHALYARTHALYAHKHTNTNAYMDVNITL